MNMPFSLVPMSRLARAGGYGRGVKDSRLAHINPAEDRLLRAHGGEGSINPRTGLPQYKYGADTKEGGATGKQSGGANSSGGGGGGSDGGTKKVGNATVADHMIATGGIDVPSIGSGGMAQGNYASQDDAYTDFASAIGEYDTRGLLGKVADFFGGSWFDQQEPISQNPRTFAQGTYHTSSNPGGIVAGLAGGMVNPAFGQFTGPVGAWGYNALGGKNIFHGGYDQPDTGKYSDPSGGWGQASSGGLLGGGDPSDPQGNRGAGGGLLQPTQPGVTPQAPVMPAAEHDAEKAKERQKRMYALNGVNIPGPTPYSFTGAKWL